jgi:hypothetical protein
MNRMGSMGGEGLMDATSKAMGGAAVWLGAAGAAAGGGAVCPGAAKAVIGEMTAMQAAIRNHE